ncbi:MAG: hypothetical protein HQ580_11760 [Planctomycetes bacterium]|nr:hypothetical protein [Planctomycetota bacterium]
MEATKGIVILLILVLLGSVPAQSANRPATAKISSTHTASCLVKITYDPLVLSLDNITIDYLLHSTSVGGKVTREILDISPDQVSDIFKIETLGGTTGSRLPELSPMRRTTPTGLNEYEYEMMMEMERVGREYTASTARPGSFRRTSATTATPRSPAAEQTILFKLQVDLPENVKPAAEEFMYALVDSLRSTLVKVFEDYKLRFENQLKLADQEATRAETDLREKQKTLREISRSRVLDRDQILADIYRLRQGVQAAKMNQASNQVTIDATTKRISGIQTKITVQLENDAISIELQKIIDLIGKLLVEAEKQAKAGRISTSQVDEIKEKLARARIELARRRESLSNSIGGNLIESLNKELADRSIQATQQEASLTSLERQQVEAESLLAKADDYELLSLKADMAKQSLQESILWRDRTSRQIRLLQSPMVSILGGE